MPSAPKPLSNSLTPGSRLLSLVISLAVGLSALTTAGAPALAQGQAPPSSTILPTDVVPLPAAQERTSFGENLQLRVLQRLPAPFYFTCTYEQSVRYETNVFQFPTKRVLLREITTPGQFRTANAFQQAQILRTLNEASAHDVVMRILPNITWGWQVKPRTNIYGNFFMIRDQLSHWTQLNTIIYSLSYGAQQNIPVTRRGNLQLDMQFRTLWQLHQKEVFDFLPGATFSYILTPRAVLYANSLCQFRGRGEYHSPNREIDPFYTWGGYYTRGGWSFSASTTFVQNFRQPFRHNALIPINSYSFISDYEIARRVIRQLPGLQVFARAEPIWNFHTRYKPGLTGMDFRMYFGGRFQFGKPALTAALQQIRQQLEEQENVPPSQPKPPGEAKPSAFIMPYQVVADSPQPIHGYLPGPAAAEAPEADSMASLPAPDRGAALASASSVAETAPSPAPPEVDQALPAVSTTAAAQQAPSAAAAETPVPAVEPAAAPSPARAEEPYKEVVETAAPPPPEIKPLLANAAPELPPLATPAPEIKESLPEPQAVADDTKMIVVLPPSSPAPVNDQNAAAGDRRSIASRVEAASAEPRDGAAAKHAVAAKAGRDRASGKHRKKRRDRKEPVSQGSANDGARTPEASRANKDIQMVIVPPLPAIKVDCRDNPFVNSGVDLKPPVLLNTIR